MDVKDEFNFGKKKSNAEVPRSPSRGRFRKSRPPVPAGSLYNKGDHTNGKSAAAICAHGTLPFLHLWSQAWPIFRRISRRYTELSAETHHQIESCYGALTPFPQLAISAAYRWLRLSETPRDDERYADFREKKRLKKKFIPAFIA